MKEFFRDNLKLRFVFLIIQTILCNALLLVAVSHFLTFLFYYHMAQEKFSQQTAYFLVSLVLMIFSCCFVYLNKQFYAKYLFYKITIAEKILARNGILTAQFIRPRNINVVTNVELGSLNYHSGFKELNTCIEVAMKSGRILISENNDLETRFYIFGREQTNVKIANFKAQDINELVHEKNVESVEPEAN